MNSEELRHRRTVQGKDVEYMAKLIDKSTDSYYKKEKGKVNFLPEEIRLITNDLKLTGDEAYSIFLQ